MSEASGPSKMWVEPGMRFRFIGANCGWISESPEILGKTCTVVEVSCDSKLASRFSVRVEWDEPLARCFNPENPVWSQDAFRPDGSNWFERIEDAPDMWLELELI